MNKYPEQYIYSKNNWMTGYTPNTVFAGGKYPVIGNEQWETYDDAKSFVDDVNSSAIPGLLVSVVNDADEKNNGVYLVVSVADKKKGISEGKLLKLADTKYVEDFLQTILEGLQGLQGLEGIVGQQGPQGEQGEKGDKGDKGDGIHIKSSKDECTEPGDIYIDEEGNLQVSDGEGEFTSVGNLKGPQGDKGDKGEDGNDGKSVSIKSSKDECTEPGDMYVDEDGNLQVRDDEGNFTEVGNLKGPQGEQGEKGEDGNGLTIKETSDDCTEVGDAYIDEDGDLQISDGEGNFTNGGKIRGPQGDKGDKGDGLSFKTSPEECVEPGDAYIDDDGDLQVSDGEGGFINCGKVRGPQGDKGEDADVEGLQKEMRDLIDGVQGQITEITNWLGGHQDALEGHQQALEDIFVNIEIINQIPGLQSAVEMILDNFLIADDGGVQGGEYVPSEPADMTGIQKTFEEIFDILNGLQFEGGQCGCDLTGLQSYIEGVQNQVESLDFECGCDLSGLQSAVETILENFLYADGNQGFQCDFECTAGVQKTLEEIFDILNGLQFEGGQCNCDLSGLQTLIEGVQNQIKDVVVECSCDLTGLQSYIEGVQKQISELDFECDCDLTGLQSYIEGVQNQIGDLTGDCDCDMEGLQNYIEGVQKQIDDITGECGCDMEGLQSYIEGVQQQIEDVVGGCDCDMDGLQSMILGVQSELHTFETEIYEYVDGIQDTLQSDINDCHTHCDNRMNGLQTFIEGVQTQVNDDEKKHDRDIAGVQEQIKDAINKLLDDEGATEIIDSFTEVADWIAGHQGEYNQLLQITNNFIEGFQGDLAGLQSFIEGVQSQITECDCDMEGLQSYIEGVQKQIKDVVVECDCDMEGLQSYIEGVQKQIDDITGECDCDMEGLQNYIEGVQKQIDDIVVDCDCDMEGLQSYIEGVQKQISELDFECDCDLTGLQSYIEGVQKQIDDITGECDCDMEGLQSYIEGVQKQITNVIGGCDCDMDGLQSMILGVQSELNTFETEIYEYVDGLQTVVQGDINDCHLHCDTRMNGLQQYIEGVQGQVDDDEKKHDRDIAGVQEQIKESERYKPGVPEGEEFDGAIVSEVIDFLLNRSTMPELVSEPSVNVSYVGSTGVVDGDTVMFKLGTRIPSQSDFSGKNSRGEVTLNTAAGDKNYAGRPSESFKIEGGSFSSATYTTDGEKELTVTYSVTFMEGAQLLDSKSNPVDESYELQKYPGGTMDKKMTLHFVYPLYSNTTENLVGDEEYVGDYMKDDASYIFEIGAEPAESDLKFKFLVPSHLTVKSVHQFNPISRGYDIPINMVEEENTSKRNSIDYKVYIRTKDVHNYKAKATYKVVVEKYNK